MSTPTAPEKDELLDQLKQAIHNLRVIKGRLPYLSAISDELGRMNGDDGIPVRNYAVYQMVRDSYDMLVIDLASLRDGLTNYRGIFNRLCAATERFRTFTAADCDPGSPIYVGRRKRSPEHMRSFEVKLRERMAADWNGALEWLFPNGIPVKEADVKALIARFLKETKPTGRDRNEVRAHRYENHPQDTSKLRQPLSQLAEQVAVFERYLNKLFLVLTPGSWHDMHAIRRSGNPRRTANDIADIIVWGSISQAARQYGALLADADGHPDSHSRYRDRFVSAQDGE